MGVVYFKYKSAKEFDSVSVDGPFISVANLKEKILKSRKFGAGKDFDLLISDGQSRQDYVDDEKLIPRNSSVLVRRIPGLPHVPILLSETQNSKILKEADDVPQLVSTQFIENSSSLKSSRSTITFDSALQPEGSELEQCGDDLFADPRSLMGPDILYNESAEEDRKIAALVNTPALDWPRRTKVSSRFEWNMRNGTASRTTAFQGSGLVSKKPPEGYICHRCSVPGHFIQHCPTNGDPNYDFKVLKRPVGIPSSMLAQTPDGSYALENGRAADLKPNEAVFEREMGAVPSARPLRDIPAELQCPLCNKIMKSAVFTSKCCFKSFCDQCIRDHIISKSKCACGLSNVLADDLLPNVTLREMIARLLESTTSSAENSGSLTNVQDVKSAHRPKSKVSATILSTGDQEACCSNKNMANAEASTEDTKVVFDHPKQCLPSSGGIKKDSLLEIDLQTSDVHETTAKGYDQLPENKVLLKNASVEPDMYYHWGAFDDFAAANLAYGGYWRMADSGLGGYTAAPYASGFPYLNFYAGVNDGSPTFPFGGMGCIVPKDFNQRMRGDVDPSRGRQKRRAHESNAGISDKSCHSKRRHTLY